MQRQEAAIRSRLATGAAAAVALWSLVAVAVFIATAWHAAFSDANAISWFGLCAGTTLAVALNLFADMTFHQSATVRDRDGHGSLAAFLVTVLPPFVPAAVLISEPSFFAVGYLSVLFAAVSLIAWSVGERRDFLRLVEFVRRLRATRTAAEPPLKPVTREEPVAPLQTTARLAAPSIVILPQVRPTRPVVGAEPSRNRPDPNVAAAVAPSEKLAPPVRPPQVDAPPARTERSFKSHAEHAQPPQPKASQWIRRVHDEAGSERIEGTARIEFAAGQKQATLHIPFIPPLASIPKLECHALDGAPVRLKVGLAQMFGARIEARRSDSAQEAIVVEIGFTTVPNGTHSNAA